MTLPIAFSTLACPDWSWGELLMHAAADGYQGIEIRLLQRETNLLVLPQFQPAEWPARRAELESRKLVVCGLGSSVRFDYADPAELASQHETGCRYVDLAQGLGARFVRVFGDTLPPRDPEGRERVFRQVAEGLERLGTYAAKRNVQVLIETHGDFADSNVMRELLQCVSAPAVGVLWDTHHPWRFYGEEVAETFERLRPWVRHTHWKDSIGAPTVALDPVARAAAVGYRNSAGF